MPRHKHPEETRPNILKTATQLFTDRGWDNVNIQDIVEAVGVTRGAFYHYFKSREDIIEAVITQMFAENNPFILASKQTNLNALEKLQLAFKYSVNPDTNHMLAVDIIKLMENPIVLKNELFGSVNQLAPYIEKILVEGQTDGSIKASQPKQTSEAIAVLLNIWLNPAVFKVSVDEYKEKLLYLGNMLEKLGIPVMDDELMKVCIKHFKQQYLR